MKTAVLTISWLAITLLLLCAEESIDKQLLDIKTLIEQKQIEPAIVKYHDLIKTHTDDIGIHRSYQNFMTSIGRTEEIRTEYKTRLESEPGKAIWYYLYGRISGPTELEASFKQAITLQADLFWPHYGLALFYKDQKRWPEAIKELDISRKLNPDNLEILYTLALTYYYSGQTKNALNTWQQMITLNPDNLEARLGAALCLKRQGKYDAAINELNTILTKNELFVKAYEPLIQCYHAKNDYKSADNFIKAARGLYANNPKLFSGNEIIIDWQIINDTCLLVATLPLDASFIQNNLEILYQFKVYYEITQSALENKSELPEPHQIIRLETQREPNQTIPLELLTLRLNLLERNKTGWAVEKTLKEYHFRIPTYQEVLNYIKKYPQ